MASFLQSLILVGAESGSHASGVTHFVVPANQIVIFTIVMSAGTTVGIPAINGASLTPDPNNTATRAMYKNIILGPADSFSSSAGTGSTTSWFGIVLTNST